MNLLFKSNSEPKPEDLARWERIRQKGRFSFALLWGAGILGVATFVLWTILSYALGLGFKFLMMRAIVCPLAGFLGNWFSWPKIENWYRKHGGRIN